MNNEPKSSGYYFVKLYRDSPWRPLWYDRTKKTFDAIGYYLKPSQVYQVFHQKIQVPD